MVIEAHKLDHTLIKCFFKHKESIARKDGSGYDIREWNMLKLLNAAGRELYTGEATLQYQKRFHEEWRQYQDDLEQIGDGTSIKELPTITPEQVKDCKRSNIITIEALAIITDKVMHRLGADGSTLVSYAKQFVKEKPITAANSALQSELDELRAQLAEMKADKPKRGRKKKVKDNEPIDDNTESIEANTPI